MKQDQRLANRARPDKRRDDVRDNPIAQPDRLTRKPDQKGRRETRGTGDRLGEAQAHHEQRHREDKRGERTGSTDVEHDRPPYRRASQANEGTQRSDQREVGRERNEVGKTRTYPVNPGGHVVPHLVSDQDTEKREREGRTQPQNAQVQARWIRNHRFPDIEHLGAEGVESDHQGA